MQSASRTIRAFIIGNVSGTCGVPLLLRVGHFLIHLKQMASELNFRFEPLLEDHLPRLFKWLQRPHVREFYQRDTPVWNILKVNTRDSPTRQYIISADRPIGYIQTWRIADYPKYTASWGVSAGISLDYLIGEPDFIGRGLGSRILIHFLQEIAFPMFPDEECCWIVHDHLNQRAIRASKAAGFRQSHEVDFHGSTHALLQLMRDSCFGDRNLRRVRIS
jgi:aminoglycoside 6'-N-acetyltransferase